jgi:dolichyl-phosphate-mannose--protein O-mannosyl transferase
MKALSSLLSSFFVGFLVFLLTTATSTVAADDNDAPDDVVTCGSVVKLTHVEASTASGSQFFLNSESKNLGTGSGQQIVTAVENPTTINTMWWIREPNDGDNTRGKDAACSKGTATPIQCGQVIRLTHLDTLRNLHSHNVKSPLSRQQEVSCYGQGDGNGDNGDDWKVICSASNAKYWRREGKVYFQHVDSGKFLGASSTVKFTHQNCGHNCPIMNHAEVFSRASQDQYGAWFVEAGVHIHK